jgi:hypothetical protein
MSEQNIEIFDFIAARVRIEYLEQDVSAALHLLYVFLSWTVQVAPGDLRIDIQKMIHFKLQQLPQGCRIGRNLIELDEQFGGLLESRGIFLKRWVYEPRVKANV